jgi:hypothetical protein
MAIYPAWLGAAALAAALPAGVAEAQYKSPFHCQPPMGQQMFEIAANNMGRRYRGQPTPANKQTMCNSYRRVVNVYEKAVKYCRDSDCGEDAFKTICARREDKLAEWRRKHQAACGRGAR